MAIGLGLKGLKKVASTKTGKKVISKAKAKTKRAATAVKKKVKALNKKLSPKKTAADRKVSKLTGKDARNRNLNVGLASAAKTAGVAQLVSMKDAANKAKKGSGFGKAFASARSKYLKGGENTFTFKGKKYSVKTKDDVAKERKMASAAKRSGAKIRAAGGGMMKQMAVGGAVKKSASMLKKMLEAKKARKAGMAKMKPKKTMRGGGMMKKMRGGGMMKKKMI